MQAEEMEATLVVMGTHGLQGLEYIVGTHAVRIVGTANVPFIIVQEKEISENGYENIIVPIEMESESKQKLGLVAQMAQAFESNVHLIVPFEKDEYLRNAQERNLTYAEGFFKQKGIVCTATIASKENDDLDEAAFQLVQEKKGETYLITYAMLDEGKDIAAVAKERALAKSTIEGHVARGIGEGKLKLEDHLSKEAIKEIREKLSETKDRSGIYSSLKGKYSHSQIRMVLMDEEKVEG